MMKSRLQYVSVFRHYKIIPYKIHLHDKIADVYVHNIMDIKPTMRKLILLDIINILVIRNSGLRRKLTVIPKRLQVNC